MKNFIKLLLCPLLFISFSHCEKDKLGSDDDVVEEIFQVVEDMPVFSGCEKTEDKAADRECSTQKLLEFIDNNVIYPQAAKDNGIEGTAVVRFVVDLDGSVNRAEIVREIGGGCGAEALRVVEMMPLWIPGRQRGVPVKVYYNLPIKFEL